MSKTIRNKKFIKTVFWILIGLLISDLVYRNGIAVLAIPSSSMKETIQPGEYVWINKLIPGPRFRANKPENYRRWYLLRKPKYNDVIVFNFPDIDSISGNKSNQRLSSSIQDFEIQDDNTSSKINNLTRHQKVRKRPKMIKRVVGLPGDTIQIDQGTLYVNGFSAKELPGTVYAYEWLGSDEEFKANFSLKKHAAKGNNKTNLLYLSNKEIEETNILPDKIKKKVLEKGIPDPYTFPHEPSWAWNVDNMGPLKLPRKNQTILLNTKNIALYRHIIEVFEGKSIITKGNYLFIDNMPISKYTFKMDYYWTHGDNLPNSLDSRYWGPVPENHVVGVVINK